MVVIVIGVCVFFTLYDCLVFFYFFYCSWGWFVDVIVVVVVGYCDFRMRWDCSYCCWLIFYSILFFFFCLFVLSVVDVSGYFRNQRQEGHVIISSN